MSCWFLSGFSEISFSAVVFLFRPFSPNRYKMSLSIVSTISQKCKRCYSCIRECPARAIRVLNGQAVVLTDRCISCGHCIKVCSQNAKLIHSDVEIILDDILTTGNAYAIIAPSFAASFPDNYKKLTSALKKLGFSYVCETSFGADLISPLYVEEIENSSATTIISSSCPAVNNYIEKYFPELVGRLAKIVSPMVAMGRYLKSNFGNHIKVVFIGPCVAKKSEYLDTEVENAIDAVITFTELKSIFASKKIYMDSFEDSDFDPPHSLTGKSFPLAGGLLKTAGISSDILEKKIIVVEGKDKVVEIINELTENNINARIVDILFCEGCISGPAIDSSLNYYSKREKVIKYIEEKIHLVDRQIWKSNIYNSRNISFRRNFSNKTQRRPEPSEERIKEILSRSNKLSPQDELNCTACGYPNCREYAIAIAKGLAEEEMCLPYMIEKLESAYDELKSTQAQLQSAEKLASIGQLAAGVAHEINNPLGTILLYASMLRNQSVKGQESTEKIEDLNLIIEETNRCKNIVTNLLNFARQGKLKLNETNLSDLINRIIKTIMINPDYQDISIIFSCEDNCEFVIQADEDQIRQVLLNVLNNACEAVEEKNIKKIEISLYNENDFSVISIKDNGCGIPEENLGKLFTPFFTTKIMGKGTGLGLAITYGIVKMHRGDIRVQSTSLSGTTFLIRLPRSLQQFSREETSAAQAGSL